MTEEASGPRDARTPWMLATAAAGAALGWWLLAEGGRADYGMRASMSAAGAVLILARLTAPRDHAHAKAVATLLLAAWAGLVIGAMAGRDLDRVLTRQEARLWSHYHYYLGSKYFTELGYAGLYDQTLAVDAERDQSLRGIPSIRDLETYERQPTDYDARRRSEVWTDDRWEQFSSDVSFFLPKFDKSDWRRMLRDRGYNATPTGNTIYRLISTVPLSSFWLALLGLLDPVLLGIAFVVAGRVFGALKALLASTWFLLYFGSEFHIIGGPLLYDYAAALIGMACAVHRNRPMTAGALLGYAAMVRVFPGFLLAGLVVWTVVAMRREGAFPKFTNRFARGLAGAVAILFVVGCFNGRGAHAWIEWKDNIGLHSQHHRFGNKRIGLQHPFTHDWSRGTDFGLKDDRRRTWPDQQRWWAASAALLIGLWGAAAWRGAGSERDPLESLVFALAVAFAAIVVSRYYWCVAALFFLLGGRERDGPREALLGASLFALIAAWYVWQGPITSDFGEYVGANVLIAVWFVGVLIARALPPRRAAASEGDRGL